MSGTPIGISVPSSEPRAGAELAATYSPLLSPRLRSFAGSSMLHVGSRPGFNLVWMLAVHAMARPFRRELGLIVAWLVFPWCRSFWKTHIIISGRRTFSNARFGPIRASGTGACGSLMLGPLLGYGFLAGATVDLPDDVGPPRRGGAGSRRGDRSGSRSGHGGASGIGRGLLRATCFWRVSFPALTAQCRCRRSRRHWKGTWVESVSAWVSVAIGWILMAILTVTWSYGWLWPAWAALRRAARLGRFSRAFYRGLSVALAFVGSLFGSFWAATSLWRSYFFDPRWCP